MKTEEARKGLEVIEEAGWFKNRDFIQKVLLQQIKANEFRVESKREFKKRGW